MPRDSNGVYSLPVGNPVATLTVISSNWANTTLSDLSTAMTDSLSRSGEGSMLAGLKLFDGTIGAPGMTWGTETTSGFYRAGAGDFRFAIGGVDVWTIVAGGLSFGLANGSAASPSLFFTSDTDTGIYRAAANQIGLSAGGAGRVTVSATSMQFAAGFFIGGEDGTAAAPFYAFNSDPNTGMYRFGADVIGFTVNGAATLTLAPAGSTFQAPVLGQVGSGANPTFSFATDPNTGMYLAGADILALGAGNANQVRITTTFTGFSLPVRVADGAVGTPSFSFESDTDVGIYRIGANNFAMVANGAIKFQVAATFVESDVVHYFVDGTAGAPGLSFASDTNTGIYRVGADYMGFTAGGSFVFTARNTAGSRQIQATDGGAPAPVYSFDSDPDTGIYWGGVNTGALAAGGVASALWDDSTTGGDTRFWVYSVSSGTLRRVLTGAADSGGAGFRMLRIVN